MSGDFKQLIDRTSGKMQILLDRYALMQQRREQAQRRIAELEMDIEALRKENQRLVAEVEYLKVATTIVPDRAGVELTRATLSKLVREIDKCIADLNE